MVPRYDSARGQDSLLDAEPLLGACVELTAECERAIGRPPVGPGGCRGWVLGGREVTAAGRRTVSGFLM